MTPAMADVLRKMAAVIWDSGAFDSTVPVRDLVEGAVRAALAAALESGWKLVPVEPTPEMLRDGAVHPEAWGPDIVYERMIAAAPRWEP